MSLLSKLLAKARASPIIVRCWSQAAWPWMHPFPQCCLLWHPHASLLPHSTASLCTKSLVARDCKVSRCKYLQPARPLDRFGIYGSVIHGPIVHLWLSSITRLLPGTTPFLVLVKVVTDQVPFFAFSKGVSSLWQVIFAPAISTCFFVGLALLEGRRTGLLDLWREKVLLDFLVSVLARSPIKKF